MKNKIIEFKFGGYIHSVGSYFYVSIFALLILLAVILAISIFNIPGNYKILVVESGSMEPAIKRGGIVITKPQEIYQKNDVITITESANPKVSLTHRIVGIENKGGSTFFITKGDANENPDMEKRLEQNIVGKTLFSVPLVGYVINFIKTKNGLILLIILPCLLIIYSEVMKVKREILALLRKEKYV